MKARMVRELTVIARGQIGRATYKLGALHSEAPNKFDCSSFTQWLYGLAGETIPRLAYEQFESCSEWHTPRQAKPGDLVFRRHVFARSTICPVLGVGHVGFVSSDLTVLHTTKRQGSVVEESFTDFFNFASSVVCVGEPSDVRINRPHARLQGIVWRSDGTFGWDKSKAGQR